MANPYQQQVFQRKLIYLGIVVLVLLPASFGWRKVIVEPEARKLGLLEESRGDVEVLGSAARTGLSGMRGLATCGLWMKAIERQKKNQWTALERNVKQLTRLQPHLITPWLFQSWNLAYNVSVESDRAGDKYFWITRGVQLLAQGERQNRFQPNLRREVGYYTQHKICQSDETNVHRSLYQLSCIPPVERDPQNFRDKDGNIDLDRLRKFCTDHPQLARRLHSPPLPFDLRREHRKFRCASASEFVQFLDENKDVPSLFVDRLEDEQAWKQGLYRDNPLERFPVLPPLRGHLDDDDARTTAESLVAQTVPDEFDGFTAARAWYIYSQECIPPPASGKYALPGETQEPSDRLRQRKPAHMASIVFRTSPARSQTYIAERLQEEGWYDEEPFLLTDWFKPAGAPDRPLAIGVRRPWSSEAWRKAHRRWEEFGKANLLLLDKEKRATLEDAALAFARKHQLEVGQPGAGQDPASMSEEERENQFAVRFISALRRDNSVTNFERFYAVSLVEEQERTVKARKLIYQAEQKRIVAGALTEALEKYEHPDSMLAWRDILERNQQFRADAHVQEWTFDAELKYHRLYRRLNEDKLAPDLALLAGLSQAVAGSPLGADWALAALFTRPQFQPEIGLVGPFDFDSWNQPLVPDLAKETVLGRRGLKVQNAPPPGVTIPPEMMRGGQPPAQ